MKTIKLLLLSLFIAYSSVATALPSLQLGPGNSGAWSYDVTSDTWLTGSGSFILSAYAKESAWDKSVTSGYAYLVAAAVPSTANDTNVFNISVSGAGMVDSGFGTPPIEDENSLSPHGVYDTYYEVYEFEFDRNALVTIGNTEPGFETDTANGYAFNFNINIDELLGGIEGVHFDLFTVKPERWSPDDNALDKKLVYSVAPYSHDAEYCIIDCPHDIAVPEPSLLGLLAIGLLGMAAVSRGKHQV